MSVIMEIDRKRVVGVLGRKREQLIYDKHGNDTDAYVFAALSQALPEDHANGARCAKCNTNNVMIEVKQTRSADEGMTSFGLCSNCGHRWRC